MSEDTTFERSLSVVIPSRDRGTSVGKAVDSVLAAPRLDIEVVVVDDGSTDDTAERIANIGDRRLRYHRVNSTGNANRARNLGARLASSALIAFLDSDDVFLPGRVDRLIDYFIHHPESDCLVDGYVEAGRGRRRVHRMPLAEIDADALRRQLLAHSLPLTNSAITVRRGAFEAIGGYDETMQRHQDRELLLRLAKNHTIRLGTRIDVEKRRGQGSISHGYDGYIAGLDALTARCPEYFLAENKDLLRYLVVRGIVKAAIAGQWGAVMREIREWRKTRTLPKDYLGCLMDYRRGQRQRRAIAAASEFRTLPSL